MRPLRRVNRATTDGRLAREVQEMQAPPRGQGGQQLALRWNQELGIGSLAYAACNKNSTFTASNGKTMAPLSVRSSTPAASNAVTSV